ncbi:MAG: hypothetical protein WDN50_00050 [Bradyrhizobium sp.]
MKVPRTVDLKTGTERAGQFRQVLRGGHRRYAEHEARDQGRFEQRRARRNDDNRRYGFVDSTTFLVLFMGLVEVAIRMRVASTIVDRVPSENPLFPPLKTPWPPGFSPAPAPHPPP